MDDFILKRVDRLFDWLQEEKGLVLPMVLTNSAYFILMTFCMMVFSSLFYNRISNNMTIVVVCSVFLVCIWIPYFIRLWGEAKKCSIDSERFDDPDVRKLYQEAALRERVTGRIPRYFYVFFGLLLIPGLGILAINPAKSYLPPNIADILFFAGLTAHEYFRCVIPQAPSRRTQTKLVPIRVRSS